MAFTGFQQAQNNFVIIRLNPARNPRFSPNYQANKWIGQNQSNLNRSSTKG